MEIRHPRHGDVLPVPLEFQDFDPDWVWLMGNAVLIVGGFHGIIMPLRLIKFGEMPALWAHRILRHAFKECKERGYKHFMILFNDTKEEQQLLQITHRYYGGNYEPFRGDLIGGEL